ncbi:hypothetical protein [Zestomonas thermotolerans]|uniref:hypothetical protein n=1 Tax=Zestomonas thermotolerans TaxID=157784 RepID=UPI0023F4DDA8|nr:hypothetical protein [Pseudomonas thermotolerans]
MTKIATILRLMLDGHSINRFEVEHVGDHCLHSTISSLANDYGLIFTRTWEQVPNRFGGKTRVMRYSLPPSQHKRARAVLVALTSKPKGVAA